MTYDAQCAHNVRARSCPRCAADKPPRPKIVWKRSKNDMRFEADVGDILVGVICDRGNAWIHMWDLGTPIFGAEVVCDPKCAKRLAIRIARALMEAR